jgi:hypothetical protein
MMLLGEFAANAGPGLMLEFGVASGSSLTHIANHVPERTVYGFDSFEGLPEDWCDHTGRVVHSRGTYKCSFPRRLPRNTQLVIGMFQETLPPFLATHRDPVAFVHIDCDLYNSTMFVLLELQERLNNAIVVFDELQGFPEYENHERRALADFTAMSGFRATFLGRQHANGGVYKFERAPMGEGG